LLKPQQEKEFCMTFPQGLMKIAYIIQESIINDKEYHNNHFKDLKKMLPFLWLIENNSSGPEFIS